MNHRFSPALAALVSAAVIAAMSVSCKQTAGGSGVSVPADTLLIRNPVIAGFHPDPSVCRVGEDYYLVNSSFQYFPGVPVFHSRDLVNWEQVGNVLERESQLPLGRADSSGGIYAPTIRYHDGTYYMVTTNVTGGGNFFVTAKDPSGPWSDPLPLKQGGIDPSFLFEDGKCYFVSNPTGGIHLCEIDPLTGEQLTESRLLWRGTGGRYPEGPHLYKKDGWYYLLISEGGTEMAHGLTVARSRNIYGPYESNPANPIFTHCRQAGQHSQIQGTGHGDFVQAPDGSWWVVFLAYRRYGGDFHHLGRETFLAPVTWEDGWPVINGGNSVEAQFGVPASWTAAAPRPRQWREEFDKPSLGPEWLYVQNPDSSRYHTGGGVLTLTGAAPLSANDHPSLVAVRQESPSVTVQTLAKVSSGEAGLVVYQDHTGFVTLGVQGRKAVLRLELKGVNACLGEVPVGPGETLLSLSCSSDGLLYRFFADGREVGTLDTSLLSTEVVGGFTGVTIGLYAVGGKASFSYFDYKE